MESEKETPKKSLWSKVKYFFRAAYFYIFNWIFLPTLDDAKSFLDLKRDNKKDLVNWIIYTVILALVPFLLSLSINLLYNGTGNIIREINNGVIPIISFNIIASGVYFLLDYVRNSKINNAETLRKKILGISIALIFINVMLYTIITGGRKLDSTQNLIVLYCSIGVFIFSVASGVKMFLLQKKFIDSPTDEMNEISNNYASMLDNYDPQS